MAFRIIQSSRELIQRIRTDVQRNLQGSNPFLKNGFLSSISIAFGNRFYDLYRLVDYWKNQFFVNTADIENLQIFAVMKNITQGVASQSRGPIVITGTLNQIIDEGTVFTISQRRYSTTETVTISERTISIQQLTQINGLATAICVSEHRFASNIEVTISGADDSEFNGTFMISVISPTRFTFQVDASAPSSTSGTIVASSVSAYVDVLSETNGSDNNVDSGAELTIEVNTPGINSSAYVGAGGITGGTNDESIESFRERIIDAWANPLAQFNEAAISRQCKTINGVTRVWVKRITPTVGQVTVYFTRDNDQSIIPSPSDVATVQERLNQIVPMNTDLSDVFVRAPVAVPTDFQIDNIVPDSNSMRLAIQSSLTEFFRTSTQEGTNVDREQYESAILATRDIETGLNLQSFDLISPTGDITINDGQIATLGQVTFV